MANAFDQFDEQSNAFDQFDEKPAQQKKSPLMPRIAIGQKLMSLIPPVGLIEKLGEFADTAGGTVTDKYGPAAGTAVNVGLNAIPMLAGAPEKAGQVTLSELARANPVKAATLKAAQSEGYVVPPSAAGGGFLSKRLESVGGKAAVGQEAALRNQQITNRIAAKEASVPEGEPLTEGSLASARERLSKPYQQVAALDPEAKASLEALKDARFEAQTYWKHYNVSADPKSLKEAKRLDAKAASLENYLDEIAQNAGQPDLVAQLRQARVALAKNFSVERALNVGSGDIDAKVFGRMLDKGAPLSGGLQTIGKFAEAFPPYAREASGIPTPGVSKSEALAAALLGVTGAGASQYATGHPYGAAAAALPLLATPARRIALSRMMQESTPLTGQLTRPIQGSMVPLSKLGQPEPGRY